MAILPVNLAAAVESASRPAGIRTSKAVLWQVFRLRAALRMRSPVRRTRCFGRFVYRAALILRRISESIRLLPFGMPKPLPLDSVG